MSLPITYVQLESGASSWKIPVSLSRTVSGKTANIICTSSDGLFVDGENDAEAVERTYSHGSVLPPKPRFAGKDITLDFVIYSRNDSVVNVKAIFESFKVFLRKDNITLSTDYPQSLTAQTQRIDITSQDFNGAGIIVFKVFLKCAQAL